MTSDALARFEGALLPLLDDAYTLARYLLRDEHDAQDVVQDSYLRAWRGFAGFAGTDARPWLLAIVRNTAFTWRRRRAKAPVERYDESVHAAAGAETSDAAVLAASTRSQVAAALERLPDDQREVLVLREVNELAYKEIADVLDVPIGTVMSRLSRARRRMQELLGSREAV